MTSLAIELESSVRAKSVRVTDEIIAIELEDGRTVSVPTEWYPRLLHATAKERKNYEIDDVGVTWPDVEADFSIRGILLGRRSGESPRSFKFWLDHRKKGRVATVEQWLQSRRQSKSLRPKRRASKKAQ